MEIFVPLLTTSLLFISEVGSQNGYRRWCYYTNWAQYRPQPFKYTTGQIDPHLCTHISYAFATLKSKVMKPFEWNDETMYKQVIANKQANQDLKILLALGGWNLASKPFAELVADPLSILLFAKDTINFLRQRNFDGLDLDWEYPANRGSPPDDRERFTALIVELAKAFQDESRRTGKPKLILAAAVAAGKSTIDTAYEIPKISRLLDYLNLMTYDFHGVWDNKTGQNSPLRPLSTEKGELRYWNMEKSSKYWISMGASPQKINVGIALYGRTFTLLNPSVNGVGSPISRAGNKGKYSRTAGFLAYFEICKMLANGATDHWNAEQVVPYLVQGDQWVGYENVRSLQAKVNFIRQQGFGGVMIWSLDLDDFSGSCPQHGGQKYPLVTTLLSALTGSVVKPSPSPKPPKGVVLPEISCDNIPPGKYPSPRSCEEYIECIGGVAYATKCLYGLWWSQAARKCEPSYLVTCSIHQSTAIPSITTQGPKSVPLYGYSCANLPSGKYPSPRSCSEYIVCANGLAYAEQCPSHLLYNRHTNYCDNPAYVVCSINQPAIPPDA